MTREEDAINEANQIWIEFEKEYEDIPILIPGPDKSIIKVAAAKNTLLSKLKKKSKEYENDPEIKKAFDDMIKILQDKLKLFP